MINHPIYITKPSLPKLEDFVDLLQEIWSSEHITNIGPKHQELELQLSKYLSVPHVSLFNNATNALMAACKALNLKGKVITTPFTFSATLHSLLWNQLEPIFCDIEPETFNIDHEKIEEIITPDTSAILGVHVYGTPCNVLEIQNIADKHNLKVIYDAAHAFSVKVGDKSIGQYGDISAFSFHATKLFNTVEGGALTTKDEHLKSVINCLRNFGLDGDQVLMSGMNGKLNELQAAIGLLNLKNIQSDKEVRKSLIDLYKSYLKQVEGIWFPNQDDRFTPNYQYFVIRVNKEVFGISRDELMYRLREYNIFTRRYFFPLCSDYPWYKDLPSANSHRLPVAHKVVQEVLCLPLYSTLTEKEVVRICDTIKLIKGE